MTTKTTTLRLPQEDIDLAKMLAAKKGLPYQTYVKMLIREALVTASGGSSAEERRPSKSVVAGSIPAPRSKFVGKAKIVNVGGYQPASGRPPHDPETCGVYGCLMCKAVKE